MQPHTAYLQSEYHPFAPDGTWKAEWPPEVWFIPWRLWLLGYRVQASQIPALTDAVRQAYVARYGHEPPRRGQRRAQATIVIEHARVDMIDTVVQSQLGAPTHPCHI